MGAIALFGSVFAAAFIVGIWFGKCGPTSVPAPITQTPTATQAPPTVPPNTTATPVIVTPVVVPPTVPPFLPSTGKGG